MKYRKLLLLLVLSVFGQALAQPGKPEVFLWVWEYPQDMRFVGDRAGVAFLAETITLSGDEVAGHPRMQKLLVDKKTPLIAVVRIEAQQASLSANQRTKTVQVLVSAAQQKNVEGVQIDFDARVSQREFYREVLGEVRRQLPAGKRLSITALASWCMGDNWVHDLPVDEVVPMLFRMGSEKEIVKRDWMSDSVCRDSLGLSTDEPWVGRPAARVYWFHPGPWTQTAAEKAIERKWTP